MWDARPGSYKHHQATGHRHRGKPQRNTNINHMHISLLLVPAALLGDGDLRRTAGRQSQHTA